MKYKETEFLKYLHQNGTLPHRSCSGTSQQNGRAERKHRHILDTVRALLIDASCPERLWGEATLTAVYTINRVPSPAIGSQSPYERLYGILPAYDLLKGVRLSIKDTNVGIPLLNAFAFLGMSFFGNTKSSLLCSSKLSSMVYPEASIRSDDPTPAPPGPTLAPSGSSLLEPSHFGFTLNEPFTLPNSPPIELPVPPLSDDSPLHRSTQHIPPLSYVHILMLIGLVTPLIVALPRANDTYLVELAGRLLVVIRDGCQLTFLLSYTSNYGEPIFDESTIEYGATEFLVFEVDINSNWTWAQITSLGDYARLLGDNASIAVDVSKFPGVKAQLYLLHG
ncbi:hypothetical protein RHSIM_Rhsim02G0249300 [Rhododendron simsii]|uniref:Integrase catalytic domain-containing protein n=1 Tax=Rhododendron simsii TaxID=118357 RepID=A0A834HEV1_RHOSS|nr:hypothetical protein RHSIM_Rhsim02G0249300 [Rhododendron simsii]